MIAEMVPEKEYQPYTFSVLPFVWTLGSGFGAPLGRVLVNPAKHYPRIFGSIELLKKFPFALPSIISSGLVVDVVYVASLFLHETQVEQRDPLDARLSFGRILSWGTLRQTKIYARLDGDDARAALLGGMREVQEVQEGVH
ncbi:hypothetical protein ETB97_006241 [Aspergillus alliaceus]|uniref:Uncharacterized protein n=1 Tax=Petromyces alliaceus TaxID=209559 RepID=A0A5N6FY41_PETAA|nr:uncharacterized protein BDW43DRAFT_310296 [Aspergillus alliaceus]KAB8234269.1 hypothetical protein BDW43DRAFT_310296 [Aspergillus alliaceus]KAF5857127.1 hypothetical protein ETB97_006241 [Aspergillus burnettii]